MVRAKGAWPRGDGNAALSAKETAAEGTVDESSCRLV